MSVCEYHFPPQGFTSVTNDFSLSLFFFFLSPCSSKALYVRAMYLSLGVAVITVCMSQAYRMVVPVSLYLITTAIHLSSHP